MLNLCFFAIFDFDLVVIGFRVSDCNLFTPKTAKAKAKGGKSNVNPQGKSDSKNLGLHMGKGDTKDDKKHDGNET